VFWSREFDVPFGIPVDSKFSDVMTVAVTVIELGAVFLLFRYGPPVLVEAQQTIGV